MSGRGNFVPMLRLWRNVAHPETHHEGRITRPFRVGLRNAGVAIVPIAIAGGIYLLRYRKHWGTVAWWAIALVPIAVTALTLAHAYLGAAVGARRANNLFMLLLLVVLIGGCWMLTRYLSQ